MPIPAPIPMPPGPLPSTRKISKRHHYIPQFILKQFTHNGKTLFVYDKEKKEIRQQNIRNTAVEKNRNTSKYPPNETFRKKGLVTVVEEFLDGINSLSLEDRDELQKEHPEVYKKITAPGVIEMMETALEKVARLGTDFLKETGLDKTFQRKDAMEGIISKAESFAAPLLQEFLEKGSETEEENLKGYFSFIIFLCLYLPQSIKDYEEKYQQHLSDNPYRPSLWYMADIYKKFENHDFEIIDVQTHPHLQSIKLPPFFLSDSIAIFFRSSKGTNEVRVLNHPCEVLFGKSEETVIIPLSPDKAMLISPPSDDPHLCGAKYYEHLIWLTHKLVYDFSHNQIFSADEKVLTVITMSFEKTRITKLMKERMEERVKKRVEERVKKRVEERVKKRVEERI